MTFKLSAKRHEEAFGFIRGCPLCCGGRQPPPIRPRYMEYAVGGNVNLYNADEKQRAVSFLENDRKVLQVELCRLLAAVPAGTGGSLTEGPPGGRGL